MLFRFLESIYANIVAKRRERCLREAWHVPGDVKVLSVGNITMGGTGKTPAVQWLAKFLSQRDRTVVIGNGYRGSLCETGAIVSDGKSTFHTSAEVGDEALLHARALPNIPIVIGKDRVQAVQMAIENFHPQFIILDDAFQYWSLARDCDIVLLDAARPFANEHTLPLGKLRELPPALERADIIVLTRCNGLPPALIGRTRHKISSYSDAPIFLSNHQPQDLRNERNGQVMNLEMLRGSKVLSLAAIANNENWHRQLHDMNCDMVTNLSRPDHHHWKEFEIKNAVKRATNAGASAIITTEKDAVKIDTKWCDPLPVFSVRIAWKIENEHQFVKQLLKDSRRF